MTNQAHPTSQNTEQTPRLVVPTFEVDTSTAFMLHNSRDLTPIQTHILQELNLQGQKTDWIIETLVDIDSNLKQDTSRVDSLSNWKTDVDTWREECDTKIKKMDNVFTEVKTNKEKREYLKSLGNYIISALITASSAFGAVWFFIDKIASIAVK